MSTSTESSYTWFSNEGEKPEMRHGHWMSGPGTGFPDLQCLLYGTGWSMVSVLGELTFSCEEEYLHLQR